MHQIGYELGENFLRQREYDDPPLLGAEEKTLGFVCLNNLVA